MTTTDLTSTKGILAYLQQRQRAMGLPRDFYASETIYQLELACLWYQTWIFAGHTAELRVSDATLELQIGDYQVTIAQDKQGDLVAFAEEKTSGQTRQIACRTLTGYVFVNLAQTPSDFDAVIEEIHPYMQPHHVNGLKVAYESTFVEYGNWKLVFENNRECYHCLSNHPELTITYPELPTITGKSIEAGVPGMVHSHWDLCEEKGFPSRFHISSDGAYRVSRMPLLNDFTSFTMDGYDAVDKRLNEEFVDQRLGSLLLFHYPNTWNHLVADHILSFRVLPIGPQASLVTTKWLVHEDAVEGVDYQIDRLTHVWQQTNAQDKHLVEQNQLGINSPLYQPGPYSKKYEDGVIQFVEWYSQSMQQKLISEMQAGS